MKILLVLLSIATFLAISATPSYARSGCCSHHGGVSGCGCADGTPLSNTCAPYYPECYNGGQQTVTNTPQTQIYTPTSYPTYIPAPTTKPKHIVKTNVKKKVIKHSKKKKVMPTATPTQNKNFFQMIFGF